MASFEYKIVTGTDEEDEAMLNDLGADGWELVSVHVSEVTYVEAEGDSENGEGDEYVEEVATYYLKRAKA
jgi:hypothetical protein